MKFDNIKNFKNSWFIGDFEPSLLRTKNFEISIQFHPKGFMGQKHYHSQSTEYNVVIKGKLKICGKEVSDGDVFIFQPFEISESEFLEDTIILVVRCPSCPSDKVIV